MFKYKDDLGNIFYDENVKAYDYSFMEYNNISIECLGEIEDEQETDKIRNTHYYFYDEILSEHIYIEKQDTNKREVYSRSYDTTPELVESIYSLDLMYEYEDFRYFHCDSCSRDICEQNPRNGWETQYKYIYPDTCEEQICNECVYEMVISGSEIFNDIDYIKEHGVPVLWEDSPEGWEEDEYFFVRDKYSKDRYIKRLTELVTEGYCVYVNICSMAIGGLEGSVTIYKTKKENLKKEGEVDAKEEIK